jgi:oligopeptide transport system substrate-binding protein
MVKDMFSGVWFGFPQGNVPSTSTVRARSVCITSLCLLLAACQGQKSSSPAASRVATLIRISEDDPKGLDPQSFSDLATIRIASEQFEGLTRFGPDGLPQPGLAEQWSISPNGLEWRFRLKPGTFFSDGHPIDSTVFADVFERLKDPKTASPVSELFESITSVTAGDPRTVIVKLRHPDPTVAELLAHPALAALPLHKADWVKRRPIVASGAYRLISWQLNDHIALERNPKWSGGVVPIAQVDWKPVSDSLTSLRMFEAGESDTASEFPSSRLALLKASLGDQVRIAPYRGSYYFAFNTRRLPFSDVRVRTALSMSVDRKWIAEKMLSTGVTPAWGIVPPGTGGLAGFQPAWANWPKSQRESKAQDLLRAAGYGPAHPLRFEIRFNSDTDHRRVAIALATMWKPLGVEAQLLNSEASLHFASLRRADFELARSGWIADVSSPENFLAVHRSDAGAVNYSGHDDLAYDQALDKALAIADPKARSLAMRQAEALLIEDMPILPIYYYVSKSLVSNRVKGWQDNAANTHPSRTLRIAP